MLALTLVFAASLYLVGLRADRIHAGRADNEGSSSFRRNGCEIINSGCEIAISVAGQRSDGIAGVTVRGPVSSVSAHSVSRPVPVRFHGLTASEWAAKYRQMRTLAYARLRRSRGLRRTLMSRPSVGEAIGLAGVVYGYTDTLWRKARCESGLDPGARNGSEASGLFQFLPSTWATTPFGRFSVFSPYANALAAGWMHRVGRGGEWSCR